MSDTRVVGEEEIQETINAIHSLVKRAWGNATVVNIVVNCEGIRVETSLRGNISGYSMRDINGNWIKKA